MKLQLGSNFMTALKLNHSDPKTRSMTPEQRRAKWPLEWLLKDLNEELQQTHILTIELEVKFYHALLKLVKAIINHKYGTNARIDYQILPHDIAVSVFLTIVKRQKEVYSWTNLLKKVVRDHVSNYLRKEHYNTLSVVDIDQFYEDSEDIAGNTDQSGSVINKYESSNEIKPEDVIYFHQLINICAESLNKISKNITNLKDYLMFKLALYEVINRNKHSSFPLIKKEDLHKYNLYIFMIQFELAPIINHHYSGKYFYV
jgi:hypothetical protein